MKVGIDVSIFLTDGGAVGNVAGDADFSVPPAVGDTISFTSPRDGVRRSLPPSFTGVLKVKDRVLVANETATLLLALNSIVVDNMDAANAVVDYLEEGFGLFFTPYITPGPSRSK